MVVTVADHLNNWVELHAGVLQPLEVLEGAGVLGLKGEVLSVEFRIRNRRWRLIIDGKV